MFDWMKNEIFFHWKILGLAIFFAFFCRKSDDDQEAKEVLDDGQVDLDNDEEYLHLMQVRSFRCSQIISHESDNCRKNLCLLTDHPFEPNVWMKLKSLGLVMNVFKKFTCGQFFEKSFSPSVSSLFSAWLSIPIVLRMLFIKSIISENIFSILDRSIRITRKFVLFFSLKKSLRSYELIEI